jgi:hypothetical protein
MKNNYCGVQEALACVVGTGDEVTDCTGICFSMRSSVFYLLS